MHSAVVVTRELQLFALTLSEGTYWYLTEGLHAEIELQMTDQTFLLANIINSE